MFIHSDVVMKFIDLDISRTLKGFVSFLIYLVSGWLYLILLYLFTNVMLPCTFFHVNFNVYIVLRLK